MRTKTKILTTLAAGALALGAFAAGAAADDGDARQARNEMHAQMGGDMGADMGAGMMSGDSWESMQAMHDAIDPAVMQQMHDQMVELLPPDLRDDAEAMHDQMFPAMTEGSDFDHASHHPTGS